MPLSPALLNVLLTHPCPHCGHELQKRGSWFQTIAHYRCESCQRDVHIGYDGKLALFEKYARLIRRGEISN